MPWLLKENCPRCHSKIYRQITNESVEDSCYACGYFKETMARGYEVVEQQELNELISK